MEDRDQGAVQNCDREVTSIRSAVRPFETPPERSLDWLIRLRVLYVYLSRLYKFGLDPSPEERETLNRLRSRVHRRTGW